jgi:hypothetical protein
MAEFVQDDASEERQDEQDADPGRRPSAGQKARDPDPEKQKKERRVNPQLGAKHTTYRKGPCHAPFPPPLQFGAAHAAVQAPWPMRAV